MEYLISLPVCDMALRRAAASTAAAAWLDAKMPTECEWIENTDTVKGFKGAGYTDLTESTWREYCASVAESWYAWGDQE